MASHLLFLILISVAFLLTIPRINKKFPLDVQTILNRKAYLYALLVCILVLSYFNIQYLVYFSVLYIMVKTCFVDESIETFGIPVEKQTKVYHENIVCKKLNENTEESLKIVNDYANDFYSPK